MPPKKRHFLKAARYCILLAAVSAWTILPAAYASPTTTETPVEIEFAQYPYEGHTAETPLCVTSPCMPSRITLLFDGAPFLNQSMAPQTNLIAIRVYRGDELTQEISLKPYANFSTTMPDIGDYNFDGYPDLSLLTSETAHEKFYTPWFYNPATGFFENNLKLLRYKR